MKLLSHSNSLPSRGWNAEQNAKRTDQMFSSGVLRLSIPVPYYMQNTTTQELIPPTSNTYTQTSPPKKWQHFYLEKLNHSGEKISTYLHLEISENDQLPNQTYKSDSFQSRKKARLCLKNSFSFLNSTCKITTGNQRSSLVLGNPEM